MPTYYYCGFNCLGYCSSLSREMMDFQYNDISGHEEALKVIDIATVLPNIEENIGHI